MKLISRIQEFTTIYHRYIWLLNIPFVLYFAITVYQIEKMKSEVEMIQEVLHDEADRNLEICKKNYETLSLKANQTYKKRRFYGSVKLPLQKVLNAGFYQSDDWLGEVDQLEKEVKELLNKDHKVFDISQRDLDWSEKYSAIKKYTTSKYGTQLINILNSKMYSAHCSMYLCSWLYPIIQQYGDDLLLYPAVHNACDPKYAEFWVNGIKLEDKKYRFAPAESGLHYIDIEYKYLHNGCIPEKISVTKELMVY